jgi:hypothetical protein
MAERLKEATRRNMDEEEMGEIGMPNLERT